MGSMKCDLHRIARSIFSICIQSRIHSEVQWTPRPLNRQADYISRLTDIDDWQTTNEFFLFLDEHWGTLLLIVLSIFIITNSLIWYSNTADVDFFFQPVRGFPTFLYEVYTCRALLALGSLLAVNYAQIW